MKVVTIFLVFSVVISLFAPLLSNAFMTPWVVFNITINAPGGDGTFYFDTKKFYNSAWHDDFNFTAQTQNSTTTVSKTADFSTRADEYLLEQISSPGWKLDSVSCTTTALSGNTFSYQDNGLAVSDIHVWSTINCTFNEIKKIEKTPVLIVPGIMGTEMKEGSELLWADIDRMVVESGDSFMDELSFDKNLRPSDSLVSVSDVIRTKTLLGATVYDYTEGLVNEFVGQGYVEGETLFTFPYDWRYGVSGVYAAGSANAGKTNSDLLGEKINSILQQTGAEKIDVVAHSMGGLIVKKYAVNALGRGEANKIRKAVFVGVPNTGAPKSIKVLLQGDNFGVLGLNDGEVKKISENMPSSYDLLPDAQYYSQKGSFVKVVTGSAFSNTEKDLNFEETKSFLTNDHELNPVGLAGATDLHSQNFDNFDLRAAGIDLYNIVGCKAGTLKKITEVRYKDLFGNNAIAYASPEHTPGDDTVPLESATNLPVNQENKFYALSVKHGKMPSQNGVRQEIVNIISGSNLEVKNDLITQDISQCRLDGKAISTFSPVNISVSDQSGNKIGLAEDGSLINEIPNADFEIWGEHKFVYLPGGQNYNVNLTGTGTGKFTLKVDNINNGAVQNSEVFRNLPVTPQLAGQVNLSDAGTTLAVDSKIIGPDLILTPEQAENFLPSSIDRTPPEVIIEFDPATKDLKFSSTKQNVLISDQDNKIVLTDLAGNTTEISLKEKDRRILMRAEIKSIKYNGTVDDISKNAMVFLWSYDRKGNLKTLLQHVKSKNDYNIYAIYGGKNTKIFGRDLTGKINKTFAGLKILKIATINGDLSWSY